MALFDNERLLKGVLAAGASCLAMGIAAPVLAQDVEEIPEATDADDDTDDTIVVTGSRIRRSLDDSTISITEIDQAEFQFRGFVNVIEALEELPFVGPGVNNQGNSTQNGDNNAFVDLFNFGTQRTLTLIDGRRSVSSNQGTVFVPANATGAQVDLTIINPALIKRTDVHTVGSGPIYGADAVAGVVNVILNRDFEGLEFSAQGGITQRGDGSNYRVSGAWGSEVLEGRGHLVLGAEWVDSQPIFGDADSRSFTNNIGLINNPSSASGSDDIPDQLFQANTLNPQIPVGGLIAVGQTNAGSSANFFFPSATGNSARDAQFNAFLAATGQTPFEFAISNPDLNGIDPLVFAGTFGLTSGFTTVPNTDPASLALGLDRVAVPLTFDASGNPVSFDLGNLLPPALGDQNSVLGGGGFGIPGQTSIRAGQERASFNALFKYELTPNIRYEGDFLFSNIVNSQRSNGSGTQTPGASITSGNGGVPIFFNENPFVTPATLAALQDIEAQNGGVGSTFGDIGGSQFFSLTRSLFDVTGGLNNLEGNRSRTFRTSHSLYGDLEVLDRAFNWDVSFAWSRNTSENRASTDILDIEFALATDVVADANGNPVCRQQTLDEPEAVNVRNPFLTNINIGSAGGLVPTQAQIDSCVPLNLFGFGAPSQAAIDYVTANGDSVNQAQQFFGEVQFGGELFQLPAGPLQFSSTFQYRREELKFTPNDVFGLGLARQTIGQASDGFLQFFEGGTEFNAPIFGGDYTAAGFNLLELEGAVRVVNRGGTGTPNGIANPAVTLDGVTDVSFTAGGRYSPIEGLTFRGNRTRSIRSASVVETLGAPQTGFSGIAQFFACNAFFVNGGPASGIRAENCATLEASLGLDPGTFAALMPPAGTVPAGVGGNPGIQNEISNNWSVGVVIEPSFIPNLVISSDYVVLELDDEIDLAFFGLDCFDQEEFPNSIVGGAEVCEGVTLAVEDPDNPGQFIIPENNLITGNPTIPPGIPGTLSPVQDPFSVAAAQFVNVNSGSLRLRALNSNIRYSFDLNNVTDLAFKGLPDLGSVRLSGNVYYIRDFQSSNSGEFAEDVTNLGGEPGNETFQTRLDVSHRVGKFSHTLRWIRDSASVENVDDTAPLDEEPDFFRPELNLFNYTMGYEFTDNIQARLIVNNLTDARELPQFGIAGALGRNFLVRLDARF